MCSRSDARCHTDYDIDPFLQFVATRSQQLFLVAYVVGYAERVVRGEECLELPVNDRDETHAPVQPFVPGIPPGTGCDVSFR